MILKTFAKKLGAMGPSSVYQGLKPHSSISTGMISQFKTLRSFSNQNNQEGDNQQAQP